eukprot:TRINITY_DN3179_c1_g1_i2.p1 TRINITY_DN3179_c1_g1~~TRINITY_DN3179_c1_g1_i2.p1  ORF type:complete len:394 (+),score=57.39 TRINITY_DN3179_c1_g1_i2:115-1296(+)
MSLDEVRVPLLDDLGTLVIRIAGGELFISLEEDSLEQLGPVKTIQLGPKIDDIPATLEFPEVRRSYTVDEEAQCLQLLALVRLAKAVDAECEGFEQLQHLRPQQHFLTPLPPALASSSADQSAPLAAESAHHPVAVAATGEHALGEEHGPGFARSDSRAGEAAGDSTLERALAELEDALRGEQVSCDHISAIIGWAEQLPQGPGSHRDAAGGSEAGAATPRASSAAAPHGAGDSFIGTDGQAPRRYQLRTPQCPQKQGATLKESPGRPAPGLAGDEPVVDESLGHLSESPAQLRRREELLLLRDAVWRGIHGQEFAADELSDESVRALVTVLCTVREARRCNASRIGEFAQLAARLRCPTLDAAGPAAAAAGSAAAAGGAATAGGAAAPPPRK